MEGTSTIVSWPWTLIACLAGYVLGHVDIQVLEVSPISLLSPQAWKILEALIDKGVWISSMNALLPEPVISSKHLVAFITSSLGLCFLRA